MGGLLVGDETESSPRTRFVHSAPQIFFCERAPLSNCGPKKAHQQAGTACLDRVGSRRLRAVTLPHHRTCGFPHPAVEPGSGG